MNAINHLLYKLHYIKMGLMHSIKDQHMSLRTSSVSVQMQEIRFSLSYL